MSCNKPDFKSTQFFRDKLERILKNYPTCKADICNEFKDKTIDDIFEKNYRLRDSGLIRIIKVRVENSGTGKGKSSGFRVVVLVNKKHDHVAFLTLFPKTGKDGVDNLEKDAVADAISEYSKEMKMGVLRQMSNVDLELVEI